MRFAIGVEYDGRAYSGWESQRDRRTIQAELEAALARVADRAVAVTVAGRTDAGVHASAQVAHFDTEIERPERAWALGTNSTLATDVSVLWARRVPDDFHARFSARARHYRYVILNRRSRPGLLQGRVGWCRPSLEADRMQQAAEFLLGEHDFSSFRAAGCQARTARRTVRQLTVVRHGDFVCVQVRANAFLQHMVRNLVGSLVDVGTCKRPVDWIVELLRARDRTLGGVTMPAAGLYLIGVDYPSHFRLPNLSSPGPLW